jgi:adenosine deaminase
MDYTEFLRRIPKAELHCHLEGCMRPDTAIELARKHGVELPTYDPAELYAYDDIAGFLKMYVLLSHALVDREDFARVAYEAIEDAAKVGNLRYREMFWNPTNHYERGVSYKTSLDGLVDGIRAAEADLGVRTRLIAAINRFEPAATAVELVEQVLEHRCDEVIGIGQDHLTPEYTEEPERFVEAYRLAKRHGLRGTAHVGEIHGAPAANVLTALDVLGCDRIDHGYRVLDSPDITRRVRDDGVCFTTCMHSTAMVYGWRDHASHPIGQMVDAGLRVTLNSDDPPMFHTDIGQEFVSACTALGYGVDRARELSLNGVEGAWLDDGEKRELRAVFEREIDALTSQLQQDPSSVPTETG